MIHNKLLLSFFSGVISAHLANAQLFETRTTQFAKTNILEQLRTIGTPEQINMRDSLIKKHTPSLKAGETIETFYDDYYMGLVIYKDAKPHELIGFWNPKGEMMHGGFLKNGSGTVETPLNPNLVMNFTNESVVYKSGMKNGPVFYYCDCASVLRKGTFKDNQKEGLWKEFSNKGDFIAQKYIKPKDEEVNPKDILIERKDWIGPSHCMMRNPDELDIKCPNDLK